MPGETVPTPLHLQIEYAVLELPAPVSSTRILSVIKSMLTPYPRGVPVIRPCGARVAVFKPAQHLLPKLIDALRPVHVRYVNKTIEINKTIETGECKPSARPWYKVVLRFNKPFLRRVPGGLTSSIPEPYFVIRSILKAATGDKDFAKEVASKLHACMSMVYLSVRKKHHIHHKGVDLFGFVGHAEYVVHGCPSLIEILKLAEDVGVGDSPGLGFGCGVSVDVQPLPARPAATPAATIYAKHGGEVIVA